jgi:putative FmdB family regulatory protein
MPIYEFQCQECGKPFEELLPNSYAVEKVVCPSCKSSNVKKKISLFAAKPVGGFPSSSLSTNPSCNTRST